MYGEPASDMNTKTDTEGRWLWIRRSDLKIEAEALICAAQEQAIRTN